MRPHMKPRLPKGSQEYETYLEVEGVEFDVVVIYSVQGPEPDVGVDGGIEIGGVWRGNEDVTGLCSDYQLECYANEINESLVSAWEAAAEDYGRDF